MFFGHQVDNLAEPPLQHSLQHSLHPWLFQVKPHPEESFGHFLSRFRRANHLSSHHLSAMLEQRPYIVSYWETPSRRRQPGATNLQRLSRLTGVAVERFSLMRSPPGTQLHWPTRLCAECYTEAPYHKLSWQIANQSRCARHQKRLLENCPRCDSAFQLPSHWQKGECDHCHFPFQSMMADQEVELGS